MTFKSIILTSDPFLYFFSILRGNFFIQQKKKPLTFSEKFKPRKFSGKIAFFSTSTFWQRERKIIS